jgi:hypothetical protein
MRFPPTQNPAQSVATAFTLRVGSRLKRKSQ